MLPYMGGEFDSADLILSMFHLVNLHLKWSKSDLGGLNQ